MEELKCDICGSIIRDEEVHSLIIDGMSTINCTADSSRVINPPDEEINTNILCRECFYNIKSQIRQLNHVNLIDNEEKLNELIERERQINECMGTKGIDFLTSEYFWGKHIAHGVKLDKYFMEEYTKGMN